MAEPGYWMHETSGVLRPAVEAYLSGPKMAPAHIVALRAYLRQWIEGGPWQGNAIVEPRERINGLTNRATISDWLDDALDAGIDPL